MKKVVAMLFFLMSTVFCYAEVNSDGSFVLAIPLDAPGGTGGLQPSLSLQYSSNAGIGTVGVGWSLSGLTAIRRAVYEHGIEYNGDDAYAGPNGRLVEVDPTNNYYHSENNTWTRYVPSGTCGDGPCSWTAYTNGGGTVEYGTTTDSRIERITDAGGAQAQVRFWAVSKVNDVHGNYLTVEYTEDQLTGSYYPRMITYAMGNGQTTFRTVEFQYEDRIDHVLQFNPAGISEYYQRLTGVVVRSAGTLVRKYKLDYDYGSTSGRSRLIGIQMYGDDGVSTLPKTTFGWEDGGGIGEFEESVSTGANPLDNYSIQAFGHFNGDGFFDYFAYYADAYYEKNGSVATDRTYLSDGTGNFNEVANPTILPDDWVLAAQGDFNGDGLTDLYFVDSLDEAANLASARRRQASTSSKVWLCDGDGTFTQVTHTPSGFYATASYSVAATGDFNGDGLTDLFWWYNAYLNAYWPTAVNMYVSLSNGDGTFTEINLGYDANVYYYRIGAGADFNGDGLTDLYLYRNEYVDATNFHPYKKDGGYNDYVWLANGDGTFTKQTLSYAGGEALARWRKPAGSGDFNGDGLTDLFFMLITSDDRALTSVPGNVYSEYVWLSQGDGTFEQREIRDPDVKDDYDIASVGDFNGDGLTDLLFMYVDSYGRKSVVGGYPEKIWLSDGQGSFVEQTIDDIPAGDIVNGEIPQYYKPFGFDLDGDGITDNLLFYVGTGQRVYTSGYDVFVWKGSNQRTDVLTTVTNEVGQTHEVIYTPLAQHGGAVHDPANGNVTCGGGTGRSACGAADRSTRMLVTALTTSDDRGNSYSTDYSYYNGRLMTGFPWERGYLGFETFTTTNAQTGVTSSSKFLQDNVFATNTVIMAITLAPGDETLDYSVADEPAVYKCNESGCSSGYDGYTHRSSHSRQLRPGKSTDYTYDFGTRLMSIESDVSFDGYGNVTKTISVAKDGGGVELSSTCGQSWVVNQTSGGPRVIGIVYQSKSFTNKNCNDAFLVDHGKIYYDGNNGSLGTLGARLLPTKAEKWFGNGSSTGWAGSTKTYDVFSNALSTTDAAGLTSTAAYDAATGLGPVETIDPLGRVTKTGYNFRFNLPVSIINPDGLQALTTLDTFGRPIKGETLDSTSGELLRLTTTEYQLGSADGNSVESCSWFGEDFQQSSCTTVYKDGLGREFRKTTKGAEGTVQVLTEYDSAGRPYRVSTPHYNEAPHSYSMTYYDVAGRVTRMCGPDDSTSDVIYQESGVTPPSGAVRWVKTKSYPIAGAWTYRAKRTFYDEKGQVLSVMDGITFGQGPSSSVDYTYDAKDRLVEVLSPSSSGNHTTTMTYDDAGRQLSIVDPDAGTTTYTYYTTPGQANFGLLHTETRPNPNGPSGTVVATMSYDGYGRSLSETVTEGAVTTEQTTLAYDDPSVLYGFGRLTSSDVSSDGVTAEKLFSYDVFGKQKGGTMTVTTNGAQYSATYTRTRDELGRDKTITYPNGKVFELFHDEADNLTKVAYDGVNYATFNGYNERNQVGAIHYANGVETTYGYDGTVGRLTNLTSLVGATTLLDYDYTFDKVGNITELSDNRDNTLSYDYQYDMNFSRLVQAKKNPGGTPKTMAFIWDGAGNLKLKQTLDASGNVVTKDLCYTSGTNRLLADGTLQFFFNCINGNSYTWSASGNMLTKGTTSYAYTSKNMLKSVTVSGSETERNYYADGERIYKRYFKNASTEIRTYYLGDGYEIREKWISGILSESQTSVYILGVGGQKIATVTSGDDLRTFKYLHGTHNHYAAASLLSNSPHGLLAKAYHYAAGLLLDPELGLYVRLAAITCFALLFVWFYLRYVLGFVIVLRRRRTASSRNSAELIDRLHGRRIDLYLCEIVLARAGGRRYERGEGITSFTRRRALYAHSALWTTLVIAAVLGCSDGDNDPFSGHSKVNGLIYGGLKAALSGDTAMGLPVGTYFYHGNHLGSASVVTDAVGDFVTRIVYTSFGEVDQSASTGEDNVTYKFTGQEYDPEASLYYYGSRYYDQDIGLFSSADTIVGDPTDPMAFNRFMYTRGNPIRYTDPTGHWIPEGAEPNPTYAPLPTTNNNTTNTSVSTVGQVVITNVISNIVSTVINTVVTVVNGLTQLAQATQAASIIGGGIVYPGNLGGFFFLEPSAARMLLTGYFSDEYDWAGYSWGRGYNAADLWVMYDDGYPYDPTRVYFFDNRVGDPEVGWLPAFNIGAALYASCQRTSLMQEMYVSDYIARHDGPGGTDQFLSTWFGAAFQAEYRNDQSALMVGLAAFELAAITLPNGYAMYRGWRADGQTYNGSAPDVGGGETRLLTPSPTIRIDLNHIDRRILADAYELNIATPEEALASYTRYMQSRYGYDGVGPVPGSVGEMLANRWAQEYGPDWYIKGN